MCASDATFKPPAIHSAWWHPHKSILDMVVGFLFSLFVPLSAPPASSTQDEHIQHAQKLRAALAKITTAELRSKNGSFRKWSAAMGCEIVEAIVKIRRQDDLFRRWGLVSSKSAPSEEGYSLPQTGDCTVYVTFPVTLLPDEEVKPKETNDLGCLVLEGQQDILSKLSKDVPVVLFFHGGGMTINGPRTGEGLNLLITALEGRPDKKPAAIFVTVKYSLAPEHPFPAAPLEACSVVSHFLDLGYQQLHVAGVSAGGNLALVAGLEAYRAHPGKQNIKSVFAGCPMLNPACDSLSFYQNQKSSLVPFIRWCHQVYLQLAPNADTDGSIGSSSNDGDGNDDPLSALLRRGSNQKAWKESKWAKSGLRRLAEPAVDVSTNLKDGPQFILTTNAADPLHDEGVVMVTELQTAGANVSYCAHSGSHWIGTQMDKAAYKEVANVWADALFGKFVGTES